MTEVYGSRLEHGSTVSTPSCAWLNGTESGRSLVVQWSMIQVSRAALGAHQSQNAASTDFISARSTFAETIFFTNFHCLKHNLTASRSLNDITKMSVAEEEPKKGRKRNTEDAELEIDVNLPEPPSKKALRKAKKQKTTPATDIEPPKPAEEVDLKRLNGLEGERSKFGVWIGNLHFSVGKKEVYKFLTENTKRPIPGDAITRLHLPSGRDSKAQNKGFAYVDFTDQESVEAAIGLSETLLTGRPLLIKDSHNFSGRPETSKTKAFVDSQAKPPNRKIFIGNLPFDTTKETLERHFKVCGIITKTQVATFEDSGKCKGYAWVEFETLDAAETAMRGQVTIDNPKSPTGKKIIYLGRMGENKLRMEFAEDSTTRYTKRYGKAKPEQEETESGSAPMDGIKGKGKGSKDRGGERKPRAPRQDTSRYGSETVSKLTGAIVEAQGKKVTFD